MCLASRVLPRSRAHQGCRLTYEREGRKSLGSRGGKHKGGKDIRGRADMLLAQNHKMSGGLGVRLEKTSLQKRVIAKVTCSSLG